MSIFRLRLHITVLSRVGYTIVWSARNAVYLFGDVGSSEVISQTRPRDWDKAQGP